MIDYDSGQAAAYLDCAVMLERQAQDAETIVRIDRHISRPDDGRCEAARDGVRRCTLTAGHAGAHTIETERMPKIGDDVFYCTEDGLMRSARIVEAAQMCVTLCVFGSNGAPYTMRGVSHATPATPKCWSWSAD
jgi:hypothetical protein